MNAQHASPHFAPDADLAQIEEAPLGWMHALIVVLCAFGFAIDLMEIALGNALSVIFSAAPYHLRGAALSWLLSSVYVGAILGAPLMGWVADRIGPKRALSLTLLWLAVTSCAAGISPTPTFLTASRLCSGLALGAYPPLMITYLTDIAPRRRRGTLIFIVCALGYLAPPAALMTVRSLGPAGAWGIEGWRWPYDVGALCCLCACIGFAFLPEAPHWLKASSRRTPSREGNRTMPDAPDDAPPPMQQAGRWRDIPRPRWLLGARIYFLTPWITATFPLVAGPVLLARHVSLSDTLFYVAAATFGPVMGTFLSALLADRLSFRTMMIICASVMIAAIAVFFLTDHLPFVAAAMIAVGLGSAAFLPAMTAFGSDLFSAEVRGKAGTSLWVVNRLGAVASPLIVMPLIQQQHYGLALIIFCMIGGGLLAVLLWQVPTRPMARA